MTTPNHLPPNWRLTGWGPLHEGVEATGPNGQTLTVPDFEDLIPAIHKATKGHA